MRRLGRALVVGALGFAALCGSSTEFGAVPTAGAAIADGPFATGPHNTLVVAQYYPWWHGSTEWSAAPPANPFTFLPAAGWYTNQWGAPAIATVKRQIREAQAYGVNGFAWEYNGHWSDAENHLLSNTFLAANRTAPRPIKWMISFDSAQWSSHFGYTDSANHINFSSPAVASHFDAEIAALCSYFSDPNYIKVGGRPAVFLYALNTWVGSYVSDAIKNAPACNGVKPYIIGDFHVGPNGYAIEYTPQQYAMKAKLVDAISNYTLFGGYGYHDVADSTFQYAFETGWPKVKAGLTRLDAAFANGRALGSVAGKPFYPGLIPQYVQTKSRACATCAAEPDWNTPNIGYIPAARWNSGDRIANSRSAIRAQWDHVRKLPSTPAMVFVTSWNEPVEGTSVEPTLSPNGDGYAMYDDFLKETRRYVLGDAATSEALPTVRFMAAHDGQFLDVRAPTHDWGSFTQQRPATLAASQKWVLVPWYPDGYTWSGKFLLLSKESNYCLDSNGWGVGSPIVQAPCLGAATQRWTLENVTGGLRLRNEATGLVAEVEGGSQSPGALVRQAVASGAANQAWQWR